MDSLVALRGAVRQFDTRVRLVRPEQWENATPCAEWSVRDLVRHVVYELLWVPGLMAGKTVADIGDFPGDAIAPDPVAAWAAASAAAVQAWTAPGALDGQVLLSVGTMDAAGYLDRWLIGLTVHAWDLARGTGAEETLPNDLATAVLRIVEANQDELTNSGAYGPPIGVAACTDDQSELLARLGRQPWKEFRPRMFSFPARLG